MTHKKPLIEMNYHEAADGMLYPILELGEQPQLGKYGQIALEYLEQTNPVRYDRLKLSGELMNEMAKVNEEAWRMIEEIEKELLAKNPITEPHDTMKTFQHKQDIRTQAEEIVLETVIYKTK